MNRRVLVILEAGDAYPSGVIRGLIYRDFFRNARIDARYTSRQWVPLIRFLFSPPKALAPFLSRAVTAVLYRVADLIAYFKEWAITSRAKGVDVVYMSKVVSYRLIHRLKQKTRARLVLDFGDALWLPSARVHRFEDVLREVDAVTTDNEMTARYVMPYNPQCVVIHDCPQVEEFDRQRNLRRPSSDRITLGWVGTPSTLYNLFVVWEVLEKLFQKYPQLHLRLLGTGMETRFLPPFEHVRYSCVPRYNQQEMIREVLNMDIGLFPLQRVQASEVRGILKATVYMSGEAVAVASAVGQSVALIQDGVNGFLADSAKDWEDKLEMLIREPERRKKMTQAALETVRKDYTVEKAFTRLMQVLDGGASR